jgi:hypothetical protein
LKMKNEGWNKATSKVFWAEIAPCEHVVQIYENDDVFLDLLSGYVTTGIEDGDSIVIIATPSHLKLLNERLVKAGLNIQEIEAGNRYFPLDAEDMLSKFMVNGWPDENLFNHVISDIIIKAKANGRQVRAFGEMVAVLWAKGQVGATVKLEQLWNKICENEAFGLFCAYPQSGFTQDAAESVMHICGAHSKMVSSGKKGMTDIFYKPVQKSRAV